MRLVVLHAQHGYSRTRCDDSFAVYGLLWDCGWAEEVKGQQLTVFESKREDCEG